MTRNSTYRSNQTSGNRKPYRERDSKDRDYDNSRSHYNKNDRYSGYRPTNRDTHKREGGAPSGLNPNIATGYKKKDDSELKSEPAGTGAAPETTRSAVSNSSNFSTNPLTSKQIADKMSNKVRDSTDNTNGAGQKSQLKSADSTSSSASRRADSYKKAGYYAMRDPRKSDDRDGDDSKSEVKNKDEGSKSKQPVENQENKDTASASSKPKINGHIDGENTSGSSNNHNNNNNYHKNYNNNYKGNNYNSNRSSSYKHGQKTGYKPRDGIKTGYKKPSAS